VTVYKENKKRGDWRMVESLIKGRDEVVRGANILVIVKGKPMHISRPVQKLYPLEVRSKTLATTQEKKGKECLIVPRRNPTRASALDARWKANFMLDLYM